MSEHPFPDDPNAEICVITGERAYARHNKSTGSISGWYGSTVADLTTLAVLDPDLPEGPICDAEIIRAIEEGRVVQAGPLTEAEVQAVPENALRRILVIGIEQVEELVSRPETAGGLPIGTFYENSDPLAYRFMQALQGGGREDEHDIIGMGQLMALIARARGTPLVPGPQRDAAVEDAVQRLRESRMAFLEVVSPAS